MYGEAEFASPSHFFPMDSALERAVAIYGFKQIERKYENAGIHWEVRDIRHRLTLGFSTLPVYRPPNSCVTKEVVEQNALVSKKAKKKNAVAQEARTHLFDPDDEKYEKYLMNLDPSETKNQDHYKVLGLKKLRYNATMEEIRLAYRAKVLKHHPDKKKHKAKKFGMSEEFFTCITKAYEQLGSSESRRRAYDSVDPKFNEEIPMEKDIDASNFFTVLHPVFERNARFSIRQPVPSLGSLHSTREDVEHFYSFWLDFNSWREFSYLDEQDKDKGEDRWERREMDKTNKVERERRRKEDIKRIKNLVYLAQSKDPRIAAFKKQDVQEKERFKQEKIRLRQEKQQAEENEKKRLEEEKQKIEEDKRIREKEAKEHEKKQREMFRTANKAAIKRFDTLCSQHSYWADDDRAKIDEMERIHRLSFLLSTDEILTLCEKLESVALNSNEVRVLLEAAETAKRKTTEINKPSKENISKEEVVLWTDEELKLLTKAATIYPAGTIDRWIVIADYVNEHRKDHSTPKKTEKQVIKQTKLVQIGVVKPTAAAQNKLGTQALPDDKTWTSVEQKQLEEGLKKYPASDSERWNKIAAEVPSRTKKACIKRYKELVELIKQQRK